MFSSKRHNSSLSAFAWLRMEESSSPWTSRMAEIRWQPNLWEIKVDVATGRPLSEARRLTQWSGFGMRMSANLSITADGKQLVMLKGHAQTDVYVAET